MAVPFPVRRAKVDFHTPCPQRIANTDAGIGKIRAGIFVRLPGLQRFHGIAFRSHVSFGKVQAVLPDVLQKIFGHRSLVFSKNPKLEKR
jgi:hypothetical protein